ncbi:MAG TPA: hypothetical protein PLT40_17240 [Ilumatobacteraceae bacterium]|nr:hypothetical protein [Ilumatobacteraceae bacterium]
MTAAPIWIECEGTGSAGSYGYCPMCGATGDRLPITQADGFLLIDTHQRRDILAMIDRGDFAP